MAGLLEMKQDSHAARQKAEGILTTAENAGRPLSDTEQTDFDAAMAEVQALGPQIALIESRNSLRATPALAATSSPFSGFTGRSGVPVTGKPAAKKVLGGDYTENFYAYIASNGKESKVQAALYEGSDPAGATPSSQPISEWTESPFTRGSKPGRSRRCV